MQGYAKLLTHPAFGDLKTLKLEVDGDSNFASIFQSFVARASEIPMFTTVHTLKLYGIRNATGALESLKALVLAFKNVKCLRGINQPGFEIMEWLK